jgi:zinc transporter 2
MTDIKSHYSIMREDKCNKLKPGLSKPNIEELKVPNMNEQAKEKLIIVCLVCSCFMIIEFFGGLMAGSLAIMTDAAHLLSDLAGFVISIFAIYISGFSPDRNYTFGYHRAEIVGALISVFIIWILTVTLFLESISRIIVPHHEIDGLVMLVTSSIGLVFNLIMVYILHSKVYYINP